MLMGKKGITLFRSVASAGGYTLMEILIVLGITIVVATAVSLNLPLLLRSTKLLDSTTDQLVAQLIDARQKAVSQDQGAKWGVHLDAMTAGGHFYKVFYGDSYAAGTVTATVNIYPGIDFLVPAQGATDDIIFEKVAGAPLAAHAISLALSNNHSTVRYISVLKDSGLILKSVIGTFPSAPLNLAASDGIGKITLNWQPPASTGGVAISNYKIYRGTSSGGETFLATVGNVLTYTDSGIGQGGVYYYKVSAVNTIGEGAQSGEASFGSSVLPSAPQNLTSTQSAAIALAWSAPASNGGSAITNYTIYRGTSSGAETVVATVGNVLAYTDADSALIRSRAYYYKVSAINVVGEGPQSNEVSQVDPLRVFVTSGTYNGNLGGLSGADAKCQTAASGASLGGVSWKAWLSDNSTAASSRIYQSGGPYALLNGTWIANSWSDLIDGNIATNIGINQSGGSTFNSVWTNTAADGSIQEVGGTCNNWTNASSGFHGQVGYSGSGDYKWSYNETPTGCPGTTQLPLYCFEQPPAVPGAPTGVSANTGNSLGSVNLAWSAPASNGGSAITNYTIYRGTSSGSETLVATIGNVLAYADSGLTNGVTYYYKVSAVNGVGEGGQSGETSAVASLPAVPTNVAASSGAGSITVTWGAPSGNGGSAITNYKIYRSTTSGSETLLTTLGAVLTYTNSGLPGNTSYYYKVSAVTAAGEGSQSGEVTAMTPFRVFATSGTYNGNLGGITGADAKCQTAATGVSLGGTWKAWISDNGTSAASRIHQSAGGYMLLNGTRIANNWSDLIDGSLAAPINVSQSGGAVSSAVWTNTLYSGAITNSNGSCSNWSNGFFLSGYYGDSTRSDFAWSSIGPGNGTYYSNTCNQNFALYCFEQ